METAFKGNTMPMVEDNEDGTHVPLVKAVGSNITTKFRDSYESYTPGEKYDEVRAPGDIIQADGNAIASSWLDISLDPLTAGTESSITTLGAFAMPIEIAVGLSMSQRTLGQEFSVEIVSDDTPLPDVPDLPILNISQAASVLTINFAGPHGLVPGKAIGVYGVPDSRLNYSSLVVASIPTPTQLTCGAGPGGNLPSVTAGPFTAGSVYFRSRLGQAQDGVSQVFENTTATNASVYFRSDAGDFLPSGTVVGNHSMTVGSTASVQPINSIGTYAFQPTTEFRVTMQADRVQFSDSAMDTTAQSSSRLARMQVIPTADKSYKFRVRATSNKGLTVPTRQIVRVTKTGTTTANIELDGPHGLTLADQIVAYGPSSQANFANLIAATAITAIVDTTTIQCVWGAAVTATAFGGYIAKVQGGNLMSALGQINVTAQAAVLITLADGTRVLQLTGNANWSGLSIGDYANAIGIRNAVDGGSLGVDGVFRIRNVTTTLLELEPIGGTTLPANFASTPCGGTVIRRTSLRLHYTRIFDYERERVEVMARPAGDGASAITVAVANTIAATISGTPSVAISGNPVLGAGTNSIGGTFAQSNIFQNETTTNLAAGGTHTGTSRDAGVTANTVHRYSAFNATATANQAGTLRIEQSNDNTTWRRATADTAVAANVPCILSVPVCTRYYRTIYVNGGVAQTEFMVNSSFTAA